MTIKDYLNGILSDFKGYVDSNDKLCKLQDMTFRAGHIPDYSDLHV